MTNTNPSEENAQSIAIVPSLPAGCADLAGRPLAHFYMEVGGSRYPVFEGPRIEESGELYRWDTAVTITSERTLHVAAPAHPDTPIITTHFPGDTALDTMREELRGALLVYLAHRAEQPAAKPFWKRLFP